MFGFVMLSNKIAFGRSFWLLLEYPFFMQQNFTSASTGVPQTSASIRTSHLVSGQRQTARGNKF